MTNAVASFGTLLKIGDGATPTEAFTTIAEVRDISGPSLSMETAEVTHHSSPGAFDEYVGTIKRGGEVTFDLNFIPADATQSFATGLLADFDGKVLRNFELVFPTSPAVTWAFSALVTGFEPAEPVDGELSASVTLQISGQPTLA